MLHAGVVVLVLEIQHQLFCFLPPPLLIITLLLKLLSQHSLLLELGLELHDDQIELLQAAEPFF